MSWTILYSCNNNPADLTFKPSNVIATNEEVPQPQVGEIPDENCYDLYRWADDGGRNINEYAAIA